MIDDAWPTSSGVQLIQTHREDQISTKQTTSSNESADASVKTIRHEVSSRY